MIKISSGEFKNNPKKYFDLVDQNVRVIVQDEGKAYLLVPLSGNNTLQVKEEILEKIKKAEEEHKHGTTIRIDDPENIWGSIQ